MIEGINTETAAVLMVQGEESFFPFGGIEGQSVTFSNPVNGVNKSVLAYALIFDNGGFRPLKASDLGGGVISVAGLTGVVTEEQLLLNLGLYNVDNTSDLNKPMSNPQKDYVDNEINYIDSKINTEKERLNIVYSSILKLRGEVLEYSDNGSGEFSVSIDFGTNEIAMSVFSPTGIFYIPKWGHATFVEMGEEPEMFSFVGIDGGFSGDLIVGEDIEIWILSPIKSS